MSRRSRLDNRNRGAAPKAAAKAKGGAAPKAAAKAKGGVAPKAAAKAKGEAATKAVAKAKGVAASKTAAKAKGRAAQKSAPKAKGGAAPKALLKAKGGATSKRQPSLQAVQTLDYAAMGGAAGAGAAGGAGLQRPLLAGNAAFHMGISVTYFQEISRLLHARYFDLPKHENLVGVLKKGGVSSVKMVKFAISRVKLFYKALSSVTDSRQAYLLKLAINNYKEIIGESFQPQLAARYVKDKILQRELKKLVQERNRAVHENKISKIEGSNSPLFNFDDSDIGHEEILLNLEIELSQNEVLQHAVMYLLKMAISNMRIALISPGCALERANQPEDLEIESSGKRGKKTLYLPKEYAVLHECEHNLNQFRNYLIHHVMSAELIGGGGLLLADQLKSIFHIIDNIPRILGVVSQFIGDRDRFSDGIHEARRALPQLGYNELDKVCGLANAAHMFDFLYPHRIVGLSPTMAAHAKRLIAKEPESSFAPVANAAAGSAAAAAASACASDVADDVAVLEFEALDLASTGLLERFLQCLHDSTCIDIAMDLIRAHMPDRFGDFNHEDPDYICATAGEGMGGAAGATDTVVRKSEIRQTKPVTAACSHRKAESKSDVSSTVDRADAAAGDQAENLSISGEILEVESQSVSSNSSSLFVSTRSRRASISSLRSEDDAGAASATGNGGYMSN